MEFSAFPKIPQFRNIIRDLQYFSEHVGLTTFTFMGTVKLHGTNAAIGYDPVSDSVYAQSRTRIISPENDNYNFAQYVHDNSNALKEALIEIGNSSPVILYGEWCGKGIQKGVAISELERMFVIFRAEISGVTLPLNTLNISVNSYIHKTDTIFFIDEFPTFNITVDVTAPELAINKLISLTEAVEKECPVGKAFGVKGVGEGIVWQITHPGYNCMFKVKGEKHSVSKVKTLAEVDPVKLQSIHDFVEYAVTDNRLNQGIEVIGLDQSTIGTFIGWVSKDIWQEEKDVLESNNLLMKDVGKMISTKARNFYLKHLHGELA